MESENHSIRFIIDDQEDLVTWTGELDKSSIFEVLVYIKNQLRKKYSTENLVFSDIDGTQTDLEKILNQELTPVFVNLPQKPEIQTTTDVHPRTAQIIYNFREAEKVKVQKFENLKKYEEVDLGLSVIKTLNEASKKRNFEVEAELALAKQKILAANNGRPTGNNFVGKNPQVSVSQTGPQAQNEEKMITPEDLANDDMTKRQKVQVHGNDGKSQWSFMNMFSKKKEEPQKPPGGAMPAYTMEDVKKHNNRQDAWMVLNNKVYDVTNYIPFHPGGAKILAGVGRDATELYNKYHPWVNADFLLAKYQVGYLKR